MRRLCNAFREWLVVRARARDEYRFHIEQVTADFRCLGMSRHAAKRAARVRVGKKRHLKIALRAIGGDAAGLCCSIRAQRVQASKWLQPSLLLVWAAFAVAVSPAPRTLIESIVAHPVSAESRDTIFFSVPEPWPLFTGIDDRDFEALRSLSNLNAVERYRAIYARGTSHGASLSAIEYAARERTRNPDIRALSLFEQDRIQMGPVIVVWTLLACAVFFSLRDHMPRWCRRRWLLYALLVGCLHLLASMVFWALAMQLWNGMRLTSGLGFSCLVVGYLITAWLQYRYWMSDLYERCPVCLRSLLLSVTEGAEDRVLLSTAVTESVCSHGHGVMVESRWMRQFRREQSPLEGLLRV